MRDKSARTTRTAVKSSRNLRKDVVVPFIGLGQERKVGIYRATESQLSRRRHPRAVTRDAKHVIHRIDNIAATSPRFEPPTMSGYDANNVYAVSVLPGETTGKDGSIPLSFYSGLCQRFIMEYRVNSSFHYRYAECARWIARFLSPDV